MRKNQYREILKNTLVERATKNSSYSLRAFARDLNLSVSYLSEVLTSKKMLKPKFIEQVKKNLKLNETDAYIFEQSCLYENNGKETPTEIHDEDFNEINDPLVFTLLSTFFLDDFENSVQWISNKLRIDKNKCDQLIQNLVKKNILEIDNGEISRKSLNFIVKNFSNPKKLREFHQKCLHKIGYSISYTPSDRIHLNHLSFAINPEKLEQFRERTDKYIDDVEKLMETGPQKDLYNLGVYLTPF